MNGQFDSRGKIRSAGVLAGVLIAAVVTGVGTAQARKKKAQPPQDPVAVQVGHLGNQLYGLDIDDAKPLTDKIQKVVVARLNTWIAHRTPNIVEVRHELDRIFSQLKYPSEGTPSVFIAPWKNVQLIGAGYTLGWSNIWRVNVVVIYENQNGHTREITTTGFVPRTDLHYAILAPTASGAFRFLAYGWRLGMSHPRLSAVLYSFDGKKLQPLWKTENLFDGKLTVNKNVVVFRYLNEGEYIRQTALGHLPPRYQKTYKLTPQGFELESEHEIPYQ